MSLIGPIAGMPVVARERPDPEGETALAAGSIAVAAGVVHLALVVAHLREATALGLLFVAAGLGEIALGVGVIRWREPRLLALGYLLLVSIVAAWLMSRTVGLPFGSDAWRPEPLGLLDGVTSAAELVACALVLRLRSGRVANVLTVYGGVLLALMLLLLLAGGVHAH